MLCPYCSFESTRVVDSRLTEPGDSIRRRRECAGCGSRFTTYERVEEAPVVVVKRDGSEQRFDRQKLLSGLMRAANKRPVSEDQLEEELRRIRSGSPVPSDPVANIGPSPSGPPRGGDRPARATRRSHAGHP